MGEKNVLFFELGVGAKVGTWFVLCGTSLSVPAFGWAPLREIPGCGVAGGRNVGGKLCGKCGW